MKHLVNAYQKEFTTRVKRVDAMNVILEETFFYPVGGGQPHDEGSFRRVADGAEFAVVMVQKGGGEVVHQLSKEGLAPGDEVVCLIDWDRRYRLMRSHTAAHLVSALLHQKTGALITGNQLSLEKVRIDFSTENYDPDLFKELLVEANALIERGNVVRFALLSRVDALAEPGLAKLAAGLHPDVEEIRIVDIESIDRQACGGTHVNDLKEIGLLAFLKAENKGAKNRRLSFTLS